VAKSKEISKSPQFMHRKSEVKAPPNG